jgi:purine nucleosidase
MDSQSDQRWLIVDTDCGVDDAIALLMAIHFCQSAGATHKLLAVTTCFGNVPVDQATKNAILILSLFQKGNNVPVYKGAASALICGKNSHTLEHSWPGHGANGMGGADFGDLFDLSRLKSAGEQCAALGMIDLVNKYPGTVDIIALGPLTNISLAVKLDSSFASKVGKFYVMGGCWMAKGNISYCAEYNFWSDPESVLVCLDAFGDREFIVVPWEVTEETCLSWEDYAYLTKEPSAGSTFVKRVCAAYESPNFYPCDAYAMATLLKPETVLTKKKAHCLMETQGKHTRGMLSIDWYNQAKVPTNCTIVTKMSKDLFKEALHQVIQNSQWAENLTPVEKKD